MDPVTDLSVASNEKGLHILQECRGRTFASEREGGGGGGGGGRWEERGREGGERERERERERESQKYVFVFILQMAQLTRLRRRFVCT